MYYLVPGTTYLCIGSTGSAVHTNERRLKVSQEPCVWNQAHKAIIRGILVKLTYSSMQSLLIEPMNTGIYTSMYVRVQVICYLLMFLVFVKHDAHARPQQIGRTYCSTYS